MRLSQQEIQHIKQTARDIFGLDARIWLFGSRTDSSLKGGDIDLFIKTNRVQGNIFEQKINFLIALENKIGEQKIYVIISYPGSEKESIFQEVLKNGIQL